MADYGNYFTSNSGNYNYFTKGHTYDDSPWEIVSVSSNGNVSKPINGAEFDGNNITCYLRTTNNLNTSKEVKNGSNHVAYFKWITDNKNTKGSITGDFKFCPFKSVTDSSFIEPTGLDDNNHGVSPYASKIGPVELLTNLNIKGTTYTAGYRKHKVQYDPSIKYDLNSYNYGTNNNYMDDGKTPLTGLHNITYQYGAYQTFYNEEDPYCILNISVVNHDNENSTSKPFFELSDKRMEYRINHSYSYNPYVNTATWNTINRISITHNTLSTFAKELVFTYDSNYNSVSYDGGTVNVEAKAWYNNAYDRFTTSTATDDGFTTYKRYADITYTLSVKNSSTMPSGTNSYTLRVWQPGSQLKISYNWSIEGNPDWAHLSNTTGNKTTVIFNDQGDSKPNVGGVFSIEMNEFGGYPGAGLNGKITGFDYSLPINKSQRSCVLKQNMVISNCWKQNITPIDKSGQPYRTLSLTQRGMTWNDPTVDMHWKVKQGKKITTTYNDTYEHGWPTIYENFNEVANDGSEITTSWDHNTRSKNIYILLPKISTPWVNTYSSGTIKVHRIGATSAQYGLTFSYQSGIYSMGLEPNIEFRPGYTSGISSRTWVLTNISNINTNEAEGSVGKFNDTEITLIGQQPKNYTYGDVTVSWKDTNKTDYLSFSATSKTWNNNNDDYIFSISYTENSPTIGGWNATADNGTITFTSTTKNSKSRVTHIKFSGTTYQDGAIKFNPSISMLTISQKGTDISGTIIISTEGTGIASCDNFPPYPIDGVSQTATYSLNPPLKRNITGPGDVGLTSNIEVESIPYNQSTVTIYAVGEPDIESYNTKKQDYKITVTSNIVSKYPANHSDGIVASGTVAPIDPSYKYQYRLNNGNWTNFENTDESEINIGINDGKYTQTYPALIVNSETDIRNGIYNYTTGVECTGSNKKTHTVDIRIIDNNDSSKLYEGESMNLIQNGLSGHCYVIGGNFTIYIQPVINCIINGNASLTEVTEKVNGLNDKNNCGKFTAEPANTNYDYSGAYDKSDERSYNTKNLSQIKATQHGESKTFAKGTTSINEVYGIASSGPARVAIYANNTYRKWKIDYKYKVKASDETTWHTQTSTYTGSDKYTGFYAYRHISWDNGKTFTRLASNLSVTKTATKLGTYSVILRWGKDATDDSLGEKAVKKFTFVYSEGEGESITEYRINSVEITVDKPNITYTYFDYLDKGLEESITCTVKVKNSIIDVEERTSKDGGTTWSDWGPSYNYKKSYVWEMNDSFSGASDTCIQNIKMGTNGTDGNTQTVEFRLTVTTPDGQSETATCKSIWNYYGITYYNG